MIESAQRGPVALHTDLSLALQIQEMDLRIQVLTREIDGLPKRIAAVEARLASHKQALAQTKAVLEQNKKDHRQFERQIDDQKQKISKLQDQMNGAKTNEQFRAFQHEIQFCKDAIDNLEEAILGKMEEAEELQQNVTTAEASLKVESAKVAEDVRLAKARIEADRSEREQKLVDRSALSAKISPPTLLVYERIRKTRGVAIAPVEDEKCGACHVRLRPKLLQDLGLLTQGILTCESCGLIIYRPEQVADEESAQSSAAPSKA